MLLSALFFLLALSVNAQISGGAAGAVGYEKAYEAAGGSAAAKKVQKNIGSALKGAAGKAKASTRRSRPTGNASRGRQVTRQAVPRHTSAGTAYRPDPSLDVAKTLADSIGTTQQEKELLHTLFVTTKTAFDEEMAAKGRTNTVSGAFTFFIVASSTTYHNSPEPSEEAVDAILDALDETFTEMPEFAQMSNKDKQQISDTLVALSGLMVLGNPRFNPELDERTHAEFRQLAGLLIQSILQTDPEKLRFDNDGLVVD